MSHPWLPGTRLFSANSSAAFVLVTPPNDASGALECDGVALTTEKPSAASASGTAYVLGKRYVDEMSGLLILCTSSGNGVIKYQGRTLTAQVAKSLPASD